MSELDSVKLANKANMTDVVHSAHRFYLYYIHSCFIECTF